MKHLKRRAAFLDEEWGQVQKGPFDVDALEDELLEDQGDEGEDM